MKYALFMFLLLAGTGYGSLAQKGLPPVGKIDKADLEMKDCDFDKGAEAVSLINWGNIYYIRGTVGKTFFNTVFEKRIRIKILKEGGLKYANVKIPYLDEKGEESINKIIAYTFNLDAGGNILSKEVNKSSIFSKRINKRYSEMIITFPEAKVGSVVEFRYTMERQTMNLTDWYFQGKIPARYSEYQINVPLVFHFNAQPSVLDPMETRENVTDENIYVNSGLVTARIMHKTYIMHNLRGIREEPFMGSVTDYMQRIEFQISQIEQPNNQLINLLKTWNDLSDELMKSPDFGYQLEKQLPEAHDVFSVAAALPGREQKIRYIFNAVKQHMQWNERENIYSENDLPNAWKNGTGNSADINLILVVLLKLSGINASPVLFSTRDNGMVTTVYPFLNQFNTVMACFEDGDKIYVLDATDKFNSYKLIPESVVNTKGFIIDADRSRWMDAGDSKKRFKVMTAVHGVIDENGIMKGDCLVNSDGYSKQERARKWTHEKEKFRAEYFSGNNSPVIIDSLTVNNAENDSLPLEQKVNFTYTLNHSGDYRNFELSLFSELNRNPFVAQERHADIDFGFLKEYAHFGNYLLPEGYQFEELPENISMIMPDTSIIFTRILQADGNLLNVRMTLSVKKTYFLANEYPDLSAFYKKLAGKMEEQIVVRKK